MAVCSGCSRSMGCYLVISMHAALPFQLCTDETQAEGAMRDNTLGAEQSRHSTRLPEPPVALPCPPRRACCATMEQTGESVEVP